MISICTSAYEGAGQGIMEAGDCNIPVISTKDHPDELVEYATTLGDEIRGDWNCDLICEKYWKPVIDSKLKE